MDKGFWLILELLHSISSFALHPYLPVNCHVNKLFSILIWVAIVSQVTTAHAIINKCDEIIYI